MTVQEIIDETNAKMNLEKRGASPFRALTPSTNSGYSNNDLKTSENDKVPVAKEF